MLEVLTPIWHAKARTARSVRQRISAVMEWAVAMDYRSDNPCGRVGPVLGRQLGQVRHMRALPHPEVAAAIETVRASRSSGVVNLAFEFQVLTAARALGDSDPLVFPSRGGKPLEEKRLGRLLTKNRIAAVPHGFRSSFRNWVAEKTNHPREVVEAAYARSDLFERRRQLMDDWSTNLDGERRRDGQPGR